VGKVRTVREKRRIIRRLKMKMRMLRRMRLTLRISSGRFRMGNQGILVRFSLRRREEMMLRYRKM